MSNGHVKWNLKKCKLEINIKAGVVSSPNGRGQRMQTSTKSRGPAEMQRLERSHWRPTEMAKEGKGLKETKESPLCQRGGPEGEWIV